MSNRIGIGIDVFGAGIDADATTIYNRIIADGGVSNLTRLNFFVKGLKSIYGDLANVPVCYDAHWIGYKLGSGTGATAGQAAAKLYSLTVAGDAVQTTAASQPLLLSHNGDNYFYVPRIDGNNCTAPDAVANRIAGDIEIISYIELKGTEADRMIISKGNASNANYALVVSTSNIPYFLNGDLISRSASTNLANANTWLRVTREDSNGNIKFWTSTDSKTTAPLSVNWTQLGTTITGPTGNRTPGTGILTVGKYSSYTNNSFNGNIFRATVSSVIGGTPVVDFNPATYNASTSQTAWTSATGEIWTISTGTATTGYKGVLVNRTIVMADGVDDNMVSSISLINQIAITNYMSVKNYNNTTVSVVYEFGETTTSIQGFGYLRNTPTSGKSNIRLYGDVGANQSSFDDVDNLLKLATSVMDTSLVGISETSIFAVNNVLKTQTNILPVENTKVTTANLYLLARSANSLNSNLNLNTFLVSKLADNATTRTATYNLIRSLNNNAF
jgi:hypothetical protein